MGGAGNFGRVSTSVTGLRTKSEVSRVLDLFIEFTDRFRLLSSPLDTGDEDAAVWDEELECGQELMCLNIKRVFRVT